MAVIRSTLGSGCGTVCVTGAGGFVASWIVKLLLEKGYFVKGTVRNPDDPKNGHLWELEGAKQRLKLCKADLLDYESLKEAIDGCEGVFHTASPVTDDPEEMVEPAVKGTKNVIKAAAAANVRRVVFTSSIGAVYMDPNRNSDKVVDETCWSDLQFCKDTKDRVEGDKLCLINAVKGSRNCPWEIEMIVSDILFDLRSFTNVQICHVFREVNCVADRLSRLPLVAPLVVPLSDYALHDLIRKDAIGRLVNRD